MVDEVRIVQHARQHRSVVYLMGRTHARLTDGGLLHLPRRYLLEMPFKVGLLSCLGHHMGPSKDVAPNCLCARAVIPPTRDTRMHWCVAEPTYICEFMCGMTQLPFERIIQMKACCGWQHLSRGSQGF